MSSESAPSSSKKWLSTGTRAICSTPASSSARVSADAGVPACGRSAISVDSVVIGDSVGGAVRLGDAPRGLRVSSGISTNNLVEEVRQAEVFARGGRPVVDPLPDGQIEDPHAEGGENDRPAAIDGSALE